MPDGIGMPHNRYVTPAVSLMSVDAGTEIEEQDPLVYGSESVGLSRLADTNSAYRTALTKARDAADELTLVRMQMREVREAQDKRDEDGNIIAGSGYPYAPEDVDAEARETLAARKLDAALRSLDAMKCAVPPEELALLIKENGIAREGFQMPPSTFVSADAGGYGTSSWDFWKELTATIGGIKTEFLDVFKDANDKNLAFFK